MVPYSSSMGLGRLVRLRTEVGGSGARLREEAGEDGLYEGAEDNLSTGCLGKSHPQYEDELEDVVEGEPVGSINRALNDSQESEDHPVRKPLSIINLARAEESF